ncbi:hypothetical protein QW131_12700 [Roseibium salinum]|nr:hypothetical protein [Roseibium salinum]
MALDTRTGAPSGTDLLRPSSIDFESLVKLSNEAVLLLGLDGRPAFVSPAVERLLGWNAESLADHLTDLVYLSGNNANAELLQQILSGRGDPDRLLPKADFSAPLGSRSPDVGGGEHPGSEGWLRNALCVCRVFFATSPGARNWNASLRPPRRRTR